MTRFPGITITLLTLTLAGCSADNEPSEKAPDVSPANVIRVAGEELTGELLNSETGLAAFRGIPFAAPPTGPLRWRPPEPHTPREGPQSAKDFGSVCPQGQGNADFYRVVASMTGADADIPDTANIDEDCLNLNVWSTATGSDKLKSRSCAKPCSGTSTRTGP